MLPPLQYVISLVRPPIDHVTAAGIYKLLLNYGPHYPDPWGQDMRCRLQSAVGDQQGSDGLMSALVTHTDGAVVAHASVIYDPKDPRIALFGAVITHPHHRRKGLSAQVCKAVIEEFDKFSEGAIMILGTG